MEGVHRGIVLRHKEFVTSLDLSKWRLGVKTTIASLFEKGGNVSCCQEIHWRSIQEIKQFVNHIAKVYIDVNHVINRKYNNFPAYTPIFEHIFK